jgi:hypothetical protein
VRKISSCTFMPNKSKIGALFAVLLLVSIALVPAVSAQAENKEQAATKMVSLQKTKFDVPSLAPYGSILVFNNFKYSNILNGLSVVAAIAAYFKITQVAVTTAAIQAVLQAIPGYYNVSSDDIYIDFFIIPRHNPFYCEVDYFYY